MTFLKARVSRHLSKRPVVKGGSTDLTLESSPSPKTVDPRTCILISPGVLILETNVEKDAPRDSKLSSFLT